MIIGIDGRYQGQPMTGVPRYIHQLCLQFDRLLPAAHFVLYAMNDEGIKLPSDRWRLHTESVTRLANLKPNLWWKFFAHRLIRKDRIDVLWCAAGLLPFGIPPSKCLLTLYDFTFRLYPRTMSRSNRWALQLFVRDDVQRAGKIAVISNGTGNRMREYYGRTADAIVYPDAGQDFHISTETQSRTVREKYGLNKPYLLAVSTLEPRKNLVQLIKAFIALEQEAQLAGHELVLIGKKGWADGPLRDLMNSTMSRNIRSLGFVVDDDLPALYSNCELFCMPSLYEGFGMPVLEARRCGARVVATDIPELREAGDDETVYVNSDASSIAMGIVKALSRPSAAYEAPAQPRSWAIGAEAMILSLNSLASAHARGAAA